LGSKADHSPQKWARETNSFIDAQLVAGKKR
jgi:hypothetical protein